jgi:glycosyltransferase involved in cell wall biosynthesis
MYGQDIMAAHATNYKADILLTNMDTWVINPQQMLFGVRWVPWTPIDHEPIPPVIAEKIRMAFTRIVYSRFGEQMMKDAGLDCYYVPMGVDTNLYKPADKSEARKRFGVTDDKFIVGLVAMNKGVPSRKAFPQNLEAFARFHKRHPDTGLYLHTQRNEHNEMGGVNLPELIRILSKKYEIDLMQVTQFCDQYAGILGFPDEYMVSAYNAIDVLLAVSMGEGFGIPIVEAQACGCPVIVGDWTSMGELCFSGWKIPKKKSDAWYTPLASYQFVPRVRAIEDALELAYKHARKPELKEAARAGALQYDADAITEKYWLPVLADIERKIKAIGVTYTPAAV